MLAAETLIKANAVAAVVFLAVGGLFGLLVALTRWPAVHLLPADMVLPRADRARPRRAAVLDHLLRDGGALFRFRGDPAECRLAAPRWAWVGFVLMVGRRGARPTSRCCRANSSVMFTSYPPMQATPNFYLGLILFAVGALIGCCVFLGTLVVAKEERTYEGSIPLVTFGALTACIIAVFTIASGAIILIPTWLWSLGYISHIDTLMYKLVWWAMGHSSQQINVSAHVAIWYLIAPSRSAPSRCPRRSAAAPSSCTSCSCSSPPRTICWWSRASARNGRSSTPPT